MSSEENKYEQQSTLFSCSLCSYSSIRMLVSEKPGIIRLSSSEPGCSITAIANSPKICQTCTKNVTTPRAVTLYAKPCECEDETLPSPTASEEDIHEHIWEPCDTPDCIHNSQAVEPSYEDSDPCPVRCTGACSLQSPVISQKPPIYIDPFLKDHTPKSIEELKASITGLTSSKKSPVKNLLGCENIEFGHEIRCLKSDCEPKDSQTSKPDFSKIPVMHGISLTKEPNDHRFCTNPDTCQHARESCEPLCPPEEPLCPPERPPCPPEEP